MPHTSPFLEVIITFVIIISHLVLTPLYHFHPPLVAKAPLTPPSMPITPYFLHLKPYFVVDIPLLIMCSPSQQHKWGGVTIGTYTTGIPNLRKMTEVLFKTHACQAPIKSCSKNFFFVMASYCSVMLF